MNEGMVGSKLWNSAIWIIGLWAWGLGNPLISQGQHDELVGRMVYLVWLLRFSNKEQLHEPSRNEQLQEPKESYCDLQKQTGILLYQNSLYFIREKSRGKMLSFYFILVDFLMVLKL